MRIIDYTLIYKGYMLSSWFDETDKHKPKNIHSNIINLPCPLHPLFGIVIGGAISQNVQMHKHIDIYNIKM